MDNADQMCGPDKSAEKFCKVCGFKLGDTLRHSAYGMVWEYELLAFTTDGVALMEDAAINGEIRRSWMSVGAWEKVS